MVLDSTVLGGTFTPSLSLGGGVVRNFFLQDRTQREDLFALPPSSKFLKPEGMWARCHLGLCDSAVHGMHPMNRRPSALLALTPSG